MSARRARGVEAQHRVEVHAAPRLVLGHLRKRQPHLSAQRRPGQPDRPGQRAVQVDGGPSPQLGGDRVPEHRALVVEAVRADRAAQQRIALAVALLAPQRPTVRAAACRIGPARSRPTAGVQPTAVHGPEAGRGQGDEQSRVLGHRLRHPLAAAQPGGDQLPGVGPVDRRAGAAAGGPPVAAGLEQHPVRLARGRKDRTELAGALVGRVETAEPDRVAAVTGGGDLALPPPVGVLVGGSGQNLANQGRQAIAHLLRSSRPRHIAPPVPGSHV